MPELSYEEIISLIPHRPPFVFLDRITDIKKSEYIIGEKEIKADEDYFKGHFPGNPVMPGVFIIESMAQAAAVLSYWSEPEESKGKGVYLLGLDKVKFRQIVRPGDIITVNVKVIKKRPPIWRFAGVAEVEGKKVAQAEILASLVDK